MNFLGKFDQRGVTRRLSSGKTSGAVKHNQGKGKMSTVEQVRNKRGRVIHLEVTC